MKVLAFVGQHNKDDFTARLGWAIVRLAQLGARYKRATHVESLVVGPWYSATIASSSVRDGGVRIKRDVRLDPKNWIVIDMPMWDTEDTIDWHALHDGAEYSWSGSTATIVWFLPHDKERKNCVAAVGEPHGVIDVHRMTTAAFIALCFSMGGMDITEQFFSTPEPAEG
jgi:hypothetical protein